MPVISVPSGRSASVTVRMLAVVPAGTETWASIMSDRAKPVSSVADAPVYSQVSISGGSLGVPDPKLVVRVQVMLSSSTSVTAPASSPRS